MKMVKSNSLNWAQSDNKKEMSAIATHFRYNFATRTNYIIEG